MLKLRHIFLSTTILSVVAAATIIAPMTSALAEDGNNKSDAYAMPAVDGINGKVEGFGGVAAKKGLYGVGGALSVPLQNQFGAQVDAVAGSFAGRSLGVIGGHLFWRDPRQGLLGLYGDHTEWSQFGGVHLTRFAGEGEGYWGRWTLHGLAGVETGNNSAGTITTAGPAGGVILTTVTTNLTNVTRFFDRADLSYYLTDNWKASVGQRYMGGKNAVALDTEYAFPAGHNTMASLFAEASVGEGSNNYSITGGVRFYIGQHDKSLIRRHREDDPEIEWTPDSLFSLANSNIPTTTNSCSGGEIFVNGSCVGVSDIRLKRDIVLLARRDDGIGLYRYRYLWSDVVYVGVMAQEVADLVPDAVILGGDGYFRVDYARLGMQLMTLDEWTARDAVALPFAA